MAITQNLPDLYFPSDIPSILLSAYDKSYADVVTNFEPSQGGNRSIVLTSHVPELITVAWNYLDYSQYQTLYNFFRSNQGQRFWFVEPEQMKDYILVKAIKVSPFKPSDKNIWSTDAQLEVSYGVKRPI